MNMKSRAPRQLRSVLGSLIALAALTVTLACGGGGGSSNAALPPPTPAGTFQTENFFQLNFADYTGNWADYHANFRWQLLYHPRAIRGSGYMTGLSLKYGSDMNTAITCAHARIRLSHTHLTDLNPLFVDNLNTGEGGQTTVLEDKTITFPAGLKNSWHEISFDQPFYFNGVDNLVVDTVYYGPCSAQLDDACTTDSGHDTTLRAGAYVASGVTSHVLPYMRWHFRGGNATVCEAAGIPQTNNDPFRTGPFGRKVQQLHKVERIKGAGPITGIALQVSGPTTEESYTLNLKMGHTSLTDLTSRFADNFNLDTPVTVAQNVPFHVPAGLPNDSWIWLPFPGEPFVYNGTDNLLLEMEVTSATGSLYLKTALGTTSERVYGDQGSSTGTPDGWIYGTRLRFAGGNVDVIEDDGALAESYPLNSLTDSKTQTLYWASELGRKGMVTQVAFRLRADALSSNYPSFTLRLGHTPNTVLGSTFAANMTDAKTVFSGTLTVPNGLKAGDWLAVPLSAPFPYDGVGNLAVEMSTQPGTRTNPLAGKSDGTRFPQRWAMGHTASATEATAIRDEISDLRFVVE